jgi:hypothetical protein
VLSPTLGDVQAGTSLSAPSAETEEEQELWVEDVASRLGLPVGMLIRRIEAGVLPARAVALPDGVRYRLKPAPSPSDAAAASPAETAVTPAAPSEGVDSSGALVAGLLDRWERTIEQRLLADKRREAEAGASRLRVELEGLRGRAAAAASEAGLRERVIDAQASELAMARPAAARLTETERIVASLRLQVAERDRALADLHAQLIRRDEQIDRLRAEVEAASGRKRGLRRRG